MFVLTAVRSMSTIYLTLDVSTSFKRLQAEKLAADAVLRELTPLESLQESDALRDYLQNMSAKAKVNSLLHYVRVSFTK